RIAMSDLAIRENDMGAVPRAGRLPARDLEVEGRRDEYEVPAFERHRLLSLDRQPARALENRAVARTPGLGAPNDPAARAAGDLRELGARLEHRDDFGERIDQDRTPANEIRTFYRSTSSAGSVW